MEEGRSAFKILTGKLIGNKLLGRPRPRWKDNIGVYLKEMVVSSRNWVDSTQDMDYWKAFENVALNLRISHDFIEFHGLLESPCDKI